MLSWFYSKKYLLKFSIYIFSSSQLTLISVQQLKHNKNRLRISVKLSLLERVAWLLFSHTALSLSLSLPLSLSLSLSLKYSVEERS